MNLPYRDLAVTLTASCGDPEAHAPHEHGVRLRCPGLAHDPHGICPAPGCNCDIDFRAFRPERGDA